VYKRQLHISLSAPLVLQTPTKDPFHTLILDRLRATTRTSKTLTVAPTSLSWHANDERTRAFLVLKVSAPEEDAGALNRLLTASNDVARQFGCARLYAGRGGLGEVPDGSGPDAGVDASSAFHISIAWSLDVGLVAGADVVQLDERLGSLMDEVRGLRISFSEVKVRMGRDVSSVSFGRSRLGGTRGLF